MARAHVADVNESFVSYWRRLSEYAPAGASRAFGAVQAVSTGTPVAVFNRVYVFEPAPREDVSRAVSWMVDRAVPFRVTVADAASDATESIIADLDLYEADDPLPGMALPSLDDVPDPEGAIDVGPVTDAAGLETFRDVAAASFGLPVEVVRQAYPAALLSDGEMQLLLGRVDGDAVATGHLFQPRDVAGVYAIAVRESHRRRGFGEAMTWAVLRAGRDAGAELGVLQASNMGYSVYERMGFDTVVRYRQFQPST